MKEKFIVALQALEHPSFSDEHDVKAWQGKVMNIITRIYGEKSIQEEQVKNISFQRYGSVSINGVTAGGGNNAAKCEKQANGVLSGLISDLQNFGIPEKKLLGKNNGFNISLNQTQNQTVNLNVILESVKEELTGKQSKELDQILKSNEDPETKKSKVLEKLKSFGSDVLSNIVANIITNPTIYGG